VMVSGYHVAAGNIRDMRDTEELITLYNVDLGPGITPKEFITFDFATLAVSYSGQNADGTLGTKTEIMYNLRESKAR